MSAAKDEGHFGTNGKGAEEIEGAKRPSSDSSSGGAERKEYSGTNPARNQSVATQTSVAAKLQNPLSGMSEEDVLRDVDEFVDGKGLQEHREDFHLGALLARMGQHDRAFEEMDSISEEHKEQLRFELAHKWKQPFTLYFLVVLCAGSAIVQGMDQTAVNGAQEYYFEEFGITDVYQQGLLNGAPYLCSALLGCWMNAPFNYFLGRRGTIFVSCFISVVTGFWMAAADSWYNLLIARFALGFAIGAKSSTTPVYSAECAPKTIRGALTMQWQMWTAFGIMLGFAASVIFQDTTVFYDGEQWRWMLASTAIPPAFVMAQVYFCPESPRWYMEKGKYDKAYDSMVRLRNHKFQAARDMYYAYKLLEVEKAERAGKNLWKEFFVVRRNRRAAQSAFFVMFMQQFCGVNVIAYYSTAIFQEAGFGRSDALWTSFGTGVVNWLFAIPAIYTIDTFGRRNLLLVGFPLMAICLLWCGFSFFIDNGRPGLDTEIVDGEEQNVVSTGQLGSVAAAIYMFMVCYSPSEGPVPFTYSAEAFPLYLRDVGMSFATATCWGFNFIISFTWPALSASFTPTGAFGWYAAWNIFGTVYAYFLLPETKNRTLEELDVVFNVGNREHGTYYLQKAPWYWQKYAMRQDVEPFPELIQIDSDFGTDKGNPAGEKDRKMDV
ncbi:hypothetical protein MBLNU230_g1822t1 [Neophaeotheca triangularis]